MHRSVTGFNFSHNSSAKQLCPENFAQSNFAAATAFSSLGYI